MASETWISFTLLWLAFAAFPGPNAAYAVAVSSRHGVSAGVSAAMGFALAVAVYVALVGAGLLAFLAASAELFRIMKWLGVGYLAYLAWQFWTAGSQPLAPPRPAGASRGFLSRAALISLTNPKSALAYVTLYPAFVSVEGNAGRDLAILGATSIVVSFLVYSAYGLLGGLVGRHALSRRQVLMRNRAFAAIFFGAGVTLALAEHR